jgi:hypothetical protein
MPSVGGTTLPSPSLVALEDRLRLESPPRDPSSVMMRRIRVRLTVTRFVWCCVVAGTEPVAEAARNGGEDLWIPACRRIGEGMSEDAVTLRNLHGP